ncbi:perlucin-like protein isoform X2 [Ostrea edulis]|uniref:perlucin-like protein isoform X2 n=1 Tax=Ostrea edulis TaxID=37623 RepID=UPI002094EFB7|nr:perlucin-like protein isoform X2 [Ostrea edulis]
MLWIYITTFFVGALAQPSSQNCAHGWLKRGSSCYLYVTHVDNDWTESEYFCHMLGAKLVEIESKEENDFLKEHAKTAHQHEQSGFWIGGTDAVVEDTWVWMTSQTEFSFSDWARNFPDDYDSNEDCAHMWSDVDFSWNDSHCDERMNFICEKQLEEMLVIG